MNETPVVWIAVHDLGRSGVPVTLLRYLQSMTAHEQSSVHVVARSGGALQSDVDVRAASVTVLEPTERRSVGGALSAGLRSVSPKRGAFAEMGESSESLRWRVRLARLPRPDVVVVHGAGAWPVIAAVGTSVPVVAHLHELDLALQRCLPGPSLAAAMRRTSALMVVDTSILAALRQRGVNVEDAAVVPGIVDDTAWRGRASTAPIAVSDPLASLDGERRWVVGIGSPDWRKGVDRFVAMAHEIGRRRPDVAFAWIGGTPASTVFGRHAAASPVRWIDSMSDPWSSAALADLVVVPSREDPLPLVALEAGLHRRAVLATPTGGLRNLLDDQRGRVTGHHRVGELCDAATALLDDPSASAGYGGALGIRVRERHVGGIVMPTWWQVVRGAAESGRRSRPRG